MSRAAQRAPRVGRAIAVVSLRRDESLAITDGGATTIEFERGGAWISQQGSFMQFFVAAGESFTFYRRGVARVVAQEDSRVMLRAPRVGFTPVRIAVGHQVLYERPLWKAMLARLLPAALLSRTSGRAV